MKNILITGAAGFIGFHLSLLLKQRGDQVIGLDNFNDYYSPLLKRRRAAHLEKIGISIIEEDVTNSQSLKQLVEERGVTHIVHLAAQAGVRYSLTNPQAYLKSNIDGFLAVLELCRQFPSVPLIYASSSSVYGLNQKIPFQEEDRTDQQASLYGVTKKANELMAANYHHLYGIQSTGLRFFTVYGPWGRPDMAYFSFAKAIVDQTPIELFNQGHMQRDFTYIDDIVTGIVAAVDRQATCDIFNLGNHTPVKLLYFVELLENYLGKKAIKVFKPMQLGDVKITYAEISKAQAQLNFYPQTSIEEGLKRFVKWFKEEINDKGYGI